MSNTEVATNAFAAWQQGEAGQGYDDFKQLINQLGFKYFSHPLIGFYQGEAGVEKLLDLIKGREAKPNRLLFTNIMRYQNGASVSFQFDSKGVLGEGFAYEGYNIIQLEVDGGQLVGFREYFGYINPSWFK